jgi:glycosyltransferase involved in cell wall biosynthesis
MQLNLVLFFTRDSSLKSWADAGILSREVAIYNRLKAKGANITFVTYGDRTDLKFESQVPGIGIICNKWALPKWFYILMLPYLLRKTVGSHWVGKSNQTLGADIGLRIALKVNQKFVARAGYLFSLNSERYHGNDSPEAGYARGLEKEVFEGADKIVVTTEQIAKEVKERYPSSELKLRVIPNYVDTDQFFPTNQQKKENQICYVGRLNSAKNFMALLEAVADLPVSLKVVGIGPLMKQAQEKAHEAKSDVVFFGKIPNDRLPAIINQSNIFVLPSLFEGHPKSLLEAMSCGLAVIATNAPGNRDLIRHEIDGYLCGTSSAEIRQAIMRLTSDRALCRKLGKNSRDRIMKEFSLDRIVELEMNLLEEMSTL